MKQHCTLFIDTSKTNITSMVLKSDTTSVEKEVTALPHASQMVLPMLEKMLTESRCSLSDITAIYIVTGPGSFTSLRVGLAIASALSVLLGIPVNDNPPGSPIVLIYEASKFDDASD